MTTRPNIHSRRRRAFTLLELMIAMIISTILVVGMSGAIMISTRSAEIAVGATTDSAASREIIEQVTRDLHFATGFTERTDTAVTFIVPDRDGNGEPETIRYEWTGVPGDSAGPLTREYNGSPATLVADDVKGFRLLYDYRTVVGVPPQPAGGVSGIPLLMVVVDADALSGQELARKALLESWGYAPAPISASASHAALDAAVAAADVAYVAAQNGSATLGTKLRDSAIGVVNEEIELHDEFGFSQNSELLAHTDTVEIVDDTHHISAPFALGDLVICTSSQPLTALKTESPGLHTLGHVKMPGTRPALGVIDTGGDLYGGGTAAGRRVQLPWGRSGFDIAALNDNGRSILARAIDWAAGGGPAGPGTFGYDTEFTTQVSGVDGIQVATKATLAEASTVTSISAYVGGAAKGVRYAIYSDDGGEPGTLIVETSDENTGGADAWVTIAVSNTPLAPGDYWLALALDWGTQRYYQEAPGATRYRNYDAEKWGFLATWGGSDDSFAIGVSIYATYIPD